MHGSSKKWIVTSLFPQENASWTWSVAATKQLSSDEEMERAKQLKQQLTV